VDDGTTICHISMLKFNRGSALSCTPCVIPVRSAYQFSITSDLVVCNGGRAGRNQCMLWQLYH
jgi:hypothetical protein